MTRTLTCTGFVLFWTTGVLAGCATGSSPGAPAAEGVREEAFARFVEDLIGVTLRAVEGVEPGPAPPPKLGNYDARFGSPLQVADLDEMGVTPDSNLYDFVVRDDVDAYLVTYFGHPFQLLVTAWNVQPTYIGEPIKKTLLIEHLRRAFDLSHFEGAEALRLFRVASKADGEELGSIFVYKNSVTYWWPGKPPLLMMPLPRNR